MYDELEELRFPGTKWHDIGNGIKWRTYKHWASGVYAAEKLERVRGDGSGCLVKINGREYTTPPLVVEARTYIHEGNKKSVSSVFSYPHGIAHEPHYFWEIYPGRDDETIERFADEQTMEDAVSEILLSDKKEGTL